MSPETEDSPHSLAQGNGGERHEGSTSAPEREGFGWDGLANSVPMLLLGKVGLVTVLTGWLVGYISDPETLRDTLFLSLTPMTVLVGFGLKHFYDVVKSLIGGMSLKAEDRPATLLSLCSFVGTIGAVFGQRTQLWWDIAVVESFRLLKRIYDVSDADYEARMARFDDILAINRYLHQPVRKLSLGERMRCDMVAALLHNPPLLFLDEPTIGLDLLAKENIRQFLKEVNREYGTTILLTTHDLSDIEELCSRLMIIDHGHILFDGPLDELKRMLWRQTQIKFELKDVAQGAAIETFMLPGVDKERLDELTYRLSFDREDFTSGDVIRHVVSKAEIRDIFIEEESIEEIVKRIYTGSTLPEMQQR